MLSHKLLDFYFSLSLKVVLPDGVTVMNPYEQQEVKHIVEQFYNKFFNDNDSRIPLFGINPGRFGAGVTGITFTDPIRLKKDCGIPNFFDERQELSSIFVYEFINAYGGPETFYARFFLSAVSPLGFIKDGKNINYYDNRGLQSALNDFIIRTLQEQISICGHPDIVICLGEGKNYKYLTSINKERCFFKEIIPLPHPRWIMQYRYRKRQEYIKRYVEIMNLTTR